MGRAEINTGEKIELQNTHPAKSTLSEVATHTAVGTHTHTHTHSEVNVGLGRNDRHLNVRKAFPKVNHHPESSRL